MSHLGFTAKRLMISRAAVAFASRKHQRGQFLTVALFAFLLVFPGPAIAGPDVSPFRFSASPQVIAASKASPAALVPPREVSSDRSGVVAINPLPARLGKSGLMVEERPEGEQAG